MRQSLRRELPIVSKQLPLRPLTSSPPRSEELLNKYSLEPNDAILASPEHTPLYSDLANLRAVHLAGGAAQNTARGAQYILPPSSVLYIGAVGQDAAAATLDDACKKAGLDTEYLRLADQPTGRCGVIITGQNRSMCTDLGAANHYKLSHLQSPGVWKHAQQASVFFVGGFHLTVCPDAAVALGKEAAARDKPFAMGFSAPFIPAVFKEALGKVIPYADYVLSNETEFGAWAEANGLEGIKQDLPAVAKAVAKLPKENGKRPRVIIVTQGTGPTIVATGAGDGKGDVKVEQIPVRPIDSGEITDTNGAGDAFAGGFLAGVVEGKDVRGCVDMGQWLAALSLRELGPSYVLPLLPFTPLQQTRDGEKARKNTVSFQKITHTYLSKGRRRTAKSRGTRKTWKEEKKKKREQSYRRYHPPAAPQSKMMTNLSPSPPSPAPSPTVQQQQQRHKIGHT